MAAYQERIPTPPSTGCSGSGATALVDTDTPYIQICVCVYKYIHMVYVVALQSGTFQGKSVPMQGSQSGT